VSGSAHGGKNVTINGTMKISLWQTCLTYDDVTTKNNITTPTTKTKCNPVQKFSFKDIKTEKTAERDGACAKSSPWRCLVCIFFPPCSRTYYCVPASLYGALKIAQVSFEHQPRRSTGTFLIYFFPSFPSGAIAGLVLGGIFALSSLIGVCRHSKAATITLLVFAVVCTAATVGCFVRFKLNTLDNELEEGEYKFVAGFWGACGTFALALVTTIVSCCMSTMSDEYFELA
jgi:hypothetical protein